MEQIKQMSQEKTDYVVGGYSDIDVLYEKKQGNQNELTGGPEVDAFDPFDEMMDQENKIEENDVESDEEDNTFLEEAVKEISNPVTTPQPV